MKRTRGLFAFLSILIFTLTLLCGCKEVENDSQQDITPKSGNSVYVYNLNGVAEYVYDNNSRITEVITLDPQTLNEFLTGSEDYVCKYFYDDNGTLEKLIYFGKEFKIESAGNNTYMATNDSGINVITATLTYNDSGILVKEVFTEADTVVLKNEFDSSGRPKRFDYTNRGKMDLFYDNSTSFISVTPYGDDGQNSEISIYLNEHGYPQYMMQTAEGAMIGTTWAYDNSGRCIDTLIESSTNGFAYIEEYEIYYDTRGNLSQIKYFAPNSNKEPVLSVTRDCVYSVDDVLVEFTETSYSAEGAIEERKKYASLTSDFDDVTTEFYAEGKLDRIENVITEYDDFGRRARLKSTSYSSDRALTSSRETLLEYNASGSLSARTTLNYGSDNSLSNKLVENYTFDSENRIKEILYAAYDSADNIIETELDEFEYDVKGNTVSKTVSMMDSSGAVVSKSVEACEYDENGEQISSTKTVYDGDGKIIATE